MPWATGASVMGADFGACRLIFGEADQFPGLTVDLYGDVQVAEVLSLGTERVKGLLYQLLVKILASTASRFPRYMKGTSLRSETRRGLKGIRAFSPRGASRRRRGTSSKGKRPAFRRGLYRRPENGLFFESEVQPRCRRTVRRWRRGCWTASRIPVPSRSTPPPARRARHGGGLLGIALEAARRQRKGSSAWRTPWSSSEPTFRLSGRGGKKRGTALRLYNTGSARLYQKRGHGERRVPGLQGDKHEGHAAAAARGFSRHLLLLALHDGRAVQTDASGGRGRRRRQPAPDRGKKAIPDHPILWGVPETEYLKFYIFQVV